MMLIKSQKWSFAEEPMPDHNRLVDQKGVDYFGYKSAELGCLFRPTSRHDKGIDGELELTEVNGVESPFLGIQVKSRSEFYVSAENKISVNVSEANLQVWRTYGRPVVLIAYDDRNKELYWTRVDTAPSTTIYISLAQKFEKTAINDFRNIITRFYGDFARKIKLNSVSEILHDFGETLDQVILPIEEKLTQAETFINAENFPEAANIYGALCTLYEHKLLLWLNWCESLIFANEIDKASTVSAILLEKFPQNWEAHLLRGEYFQSVRQYMEAEAYFLKSIELAPYSAIPWGRLGLLHYRTGRYREGFEELSQAERYDKTDELVKLDLALCCEALEDNDNALRYYDEAIALQPRLYDALNNKGVLLKNLFRFNDALDAFDKAIEINPLKAGAYYGSADLLKDLGYNERAIQRFYTVLSILPSASAHYNLGSLFCREGDFSKAAYHWQCAREINPKQFPMSGLILNLDLGFKVAYGIEAEVMDEIRIISVKSMPQSAMLNHEFFNWYAENAHQFNQPLNPQIQRDRFPAEGPVSLDDID